VTALPECFRLIEGWRQRDLVEAVCSVEWEQPQFTIFGKVHNAPRLTAWFGDGPYTYSGKRHEPAPMPQWIDEARRDIEALTGARFNSVLLNYYRSGRDSVAWHADDEPELGAEPTIASWSLGAARTFAVKPRADGERWSAALGNGDLLVMSGRSQLDYLHSVPKTAKAIGPRVNLTFRLVY
jgi:alkylated DNA repair dioxygenase AlkB